MTSPAEPFSRAARRRRRDRAALAFGEYAFLKDAMVAELLARLGDSGGTFETALDLGCHDGRLGRALPVARVAFADASDAFARIAGGVACDEDRLPFGDSAFDLIVSAGNLHGVNDLPGALVQIRRALRPGGLFLAAFPGGETLREVRAALLEAEEAVTGRVAARVLPMVDAAAASGLLQRAGFVSPVADIETLTVRYASFAAVLSELRGMGETNILGVRAPLRRDVLAAAARRFKGRADGGKVGVTVQVVWLAGRAG